MTTDYGVWLANAKAAAVEQRMDALTGSLAEASWAIVGSFFNGWSVYIGRNVGVKIVDQGRAVRVSGQFTGGTTTDGTIVFGVSSTFYPGRSEAMNIGFSGGAGVPAPGPYLEVNTSGEFRMYGAASATGGHWTINAEYPLDTN